MHSPHDIILHTGIFYLLFKTTVDEVLALKVTDTTLYLKEFVLQQDNCPLEPKEKTNWNLFS